MPVAAPAPRLYGARAPSALRAAKVRLLDRPFARGINHHASFVLAI